MAEIWGAAIAAGGAIYAASQEKGAAQSAANAQQNAATQAIQQTEQNYQRTSGNLSPYISAGNNALGQMQALNSGDYSSFTASPDYQFSLSQGIQGLDRSAAARGSLYSGGHSADILGYAQGLASQNYGNYYNRLASLAGLGQDAASNLGSIGTKNAASIGSYLTGAGSSQATAAIQSGNANTNLTSQLAQLAGQYGTQWASSYTPSINTGSYTPNISAPNTSLNVPNYSPTLPAVSYV